MACARHPHTICRLWTRSILCQAQCATKVKKSCARETTRASLFRVSRECRAQLRLRMRARADRRTRLHVDEDLQLLDRVGGAIHRAQLARKTQACADFRHLR